MRRLTQCKVGQRIPFGAKLKTVRCLGMYLQVIKYVTRIINFVNNVKPFEYTVNPRKWLVLDLTKTPLFVNQICSIRVPINK